MKVPKQINDLLNMRAEYIGLREGKLNADILSYQNQLLKDLNYAILQALDVDADGNINDSTKNYRILQTVEKVYRDFTKNNKYKLGDSITDTLNQISDKSNDYYSKTIRDDISKETFKKAIESATKNLNTRLGFTSEGYVAGGFIDNLLSTNNEVIAVKEFISKAITSRMRMSDFIDELTSMIIGDESKSGLSKRKFNQYARDLYNQYDAAYNKRLADELDMSYFIYQGGLVQDSRDFCVAHNGKVYTTVEAELWSSWTVSKGIKNNEFPEGYVIQEKPENYGRVPSYMNYDGYNPFIDRGGYNCRHILGFITDKLAEKLIKKKEAPAVVVVDEPVMHEFKSVQEANEYCKNTLKIPTVDFSGYTKNELPILNEFIYSVEYHLKKYPELYSVNEYIGTAQGRYKLLRDEVTKKAIAAYKKTYQYWDDVKIRYNAEAEARRVVGNVGKRTWAESFTQTFGNVPSGIGMNVKWTVKELEEQLKRCITSGWHPPKCDTIKSIIDHEMGHRLDDLLQLHTHDEVKYFYEAFKAEASKSRDRYNYFKENLSTYAWHRDNLAEFIAESWTEYLNNPTPRETAKWIGEYIIQTYKMLYT